MTVLLWLSLALYLFVGLIAFGVLKGGAERLDRELKFFTGVTAILFWPVSTAITIGKVLAKTALDHTDKNKK